MSHTLMGLQPWLRLSLTRQTDVEVEIVFFILLCPIWEETMLQVQAAWWKTQSDMKSTLFFSPFLPKAWLMATSPSCLQGRMGEFECSQRCATRPGRSHPEVSHHNILRVSPFERSVNPLGSAVISKHQKVAFIITCHWVHQSVCSFMGGCYCQLFLLNSYNEKNSEMRESVCQQVLSLCFVFSLSQTIYCHFLCNL